MTDQDAEFESEVEQQTNRPAVKFPWTGCWCWSDWISMASNHANHLDAEGITL